MTPLKSPEVGNNPFEMLNRLTDRPEGESKEKLGRLKSEIVAPLVGIGFILLTEYLKDLKEKESPVEKPVEEPIEEQIEKPIKKPIEEQIEKPIKSESAKKSIEIKEPSDVLVIGDSIPKGMLSRFQKGKKPDFIGEQGKSTPDILNRVRNNRDKLNGKKTAIISCGLNDLVWTDNYEEITGRISEMIRECEKAGIKEIIVLTGFPFQSGFERDKLRVRSKNLREVVLRKFSSRVKVVDLYSHFADSEGNLKKQYAVKGGDKMHPFKAYSDALKYIAKKSDADLEKLIV